MSAPQAEKRDGSESGWATTRLRRFSLAVTFFTALRLPIPGRATDADLWGSTAWYAPIGCALGALAWGIYAGGLELTGSPLLAAVIVVLALELFTRALHLDGLMDTCDGFFSGASRERALEIMKDSRVGAMGAFAAIGVILLKVTALATLSRHDAALPLIAGWAAARGLAVFDLRCFAYARAEGTGAAFARGGKGVDYARSGSIFPLVVALIVSAGAAGAIGAAAEPGLSGTLTGLAVIGGAVAVTLLAQVAVARRLGGLTGDVYGMGIELVEALALVAGCIAVR